MFFDGWIPRKNKKVTILLKTETDETGTITFIRRPRARTVKIAIEPLKGIRVTVPYGISLKKAQEFVTQKKQWIRKQRAWIQNIEKDYAERLRSTPPLERDAARALLRARVAELACQHGFCYGNVSVRAQKTRWGSCSRENNLSLNERIVQLPSCLQDYVILHELMHTRHKNHGIAFWSALETVIPGAKNIDKQLKNFNMWLL